VTRELSLPHTGNLAPSGIIKHVDALGHFSTCA
jgi:hypothetical protein